MTVINWSLELPLIKTQSGFAKVDWAFVAAIRQAENGGEGKQFGVLDGHALSYEQQLAETCASVAHRLETYPANPLQRCYRYDGKSRLRYSPSFISYFASIWAPKGAGNDPTNLNLNWFKNVCNFYQSFIQDDLGAIL